MCAGLNDGTAGPGTPGLSREPKRKAPFSSAAHAMPSPPAAHLQGDATRSRALLIDGFKHPLRMGAILACSAIPPRGYPPSRRPPRSIVCQSARCSRSLIHKTVVMLKLNMQDAVPSNFEFLKCQRNSRMKQSDKHNLFVESHILTWFRAGGRCVVVTT